MANEREVVFYDQGAATQRMLAEVLAGLRRPQKQIAPKYFYDEKGSQLFDAITGCPSTTLLVSRCNYLTSTCRKFGTGSATNRCVLSNMVAARARKFGEVLDTLAPSVYVPVDISRQYLLDNTHQLHADFPHIAMYPVCADISREFELPAKWALCISLASILDLVLAIFADRGGCVLRRVRRTLGQDAICLLVWTQKACASFGSGLQRRRRGNSAVQSQCSATFKRSAQYGF
ncbi:MAG: hypothetical protein CM15mP68_7130 [Pseudomonadota bacterium]|nr:MAG: hypothetical protein CM15mP68_7130 [Pseudomonadota bacterium]